MSSKGGLPTQAPTPAAPQEPRSFVDKATDFAGGAVYQVSAPGRTVQNLLSKGVEKITGKKGFGDTSKEAFEEVTNTDVDTTSGKAGQFVAETVQYAIPGGQASKFTKGAGLLKKAGAQAAASVVVEAANDGDVDRDTLDSAIISAMFPVAGAAASKIKSAVLPSGRETGGRVINSLIKPLLKDFSYGKNPGQAVASAGIRANSLDELASKIKTVRQVTGEEIGEVMARSTAKIDASQSLKALDEAVVEASKSPRTNGAIIKRLNDLKADILRVGDDGVPTRKLTDLTAEEAFELKRDIGDLTRWTGNASDDELVNRALTRTYGNLKGQLDTVVPESKALNEKYANLKSAEIATEYRDKIAQRANLISFSGTQLGTAAAITSAIVSGGAVVPILIGAGAGLGTEALRSPAAKTRVAAWLASASKEELKSSFQKAPWLKGALQAALFGEEEDVDALAEESGGTTD